MKDRLIELLAIKTSGSLSLEEQAEMDVLIQDPELKAIHDDLMNTWNSSEKYKVDITPDTELSWARFTNSSSILKTRSLIPVLMRVAAVLAIALGIGYYVTKSSPQVVFETTANEKREINLPDGSHVWMNENSRLAYGEGFNSEIRLLEFSGEGFFEVTRNEHSPFRIETDHAIVEVLGTSFDVDAYPGSGYVGVDVSTGKVALREKKTGKEVVLEKGMYGNLDINTTTLTNSVPATSNMDYWRTGLLVFDDIPLRDVVKDLKKHFDTSITIDDTKLGGCKFTSSFNNPTLEEVLEIISITMNLKAEPGKNGITLSGTGCQF